MQSLHAACTAALPVLNIQPACSALRPCRLAPDTTQILHCTRRARGTLRARSAIRSVCCPVCLHTAQSTCKEPKVHVHAAQSPHSDAARTPRQSPASRRASACRTQYCAHCSIFVTKRKQKKQNKDFDPTGKDFNKSKKDLKNILPKFLRQTAFPSEIMIQKEFQKRKHPLFVTPMENAEPNPSRNNAECQTTRGQVCVAPSTPK